MLRINCQKTVGSHLLTHFWYIYIPAMKHSQIRIVLEVCQNGLNDTFLTQFCSENVSLRLKIYQKCVRLWVLKVLRHINILKLSKEPIWQFYDTFWLNWPCLDMPEMCQKTVNLTILTDFWHNDDLAMFHTRQETCLKCVRILDLTVFWQFFIDNVSWKCFIIFAEMCLKSVSSDISDIFLTYF